MKEKFEFLNIISELLKDEGGYVNHPKDPGGETNFGISKRSYPHIDIKSLTEEEAVNIYYTDWWCRYSIEDIPAENIRGKLLNIAVTMGFRQAMKCLQRAIRCASDNVSLIDDDGLYGGKTKKAIESLDDKQQVGLYYAFKSEVAHYYRSLNQKEFINGWLNRAYK